MKEPSEIEFLCVLSCSDQLFSVSIRLCKVFVNVNQAFMNQQNISFLKIILVPRFGWEGPRAFLRSRLCSRFMFRL